MVINISTWLSSVTPGILNNGSDKSGGEYSGTSLYTERTRIYYPIIWCFEYGYETFSAIYCA